MSAFSTPQQSGLRREPSAPTADELHLAGVRRQMPAPQMHECVCQMCGWEFPSRHEEPLCQSCQDGMAECM